MGRHAVKLNWLPEAYNNKVVSLVLLRKTVDTMRMVSVDSELIL